LLSLEIDRQFLIATTFDINHHGDMRSGGQRAARTNVANQTNRNRLVWWTGRYAAERV